MITATQANIQALATVEALSNDIDALYVLDQQAKALADQVKQMKGDIANKYDVGTHKGELHSVNVALFEVKGSVDYAAVCEKYGISDAVLDTFRKEGRADIRVTPKK
jgi:ABC-type amino acid transport substrate-binding protein